MHFCPTGISFADVMYFTFAIVQAFPRFMPVEGARVASECLVGFWFIRPPGKSRKASAAVHVSASASVRGTGAKVKSDRNTFPHPRPATQGLTGVQLASGNASVRRRWHPRSYPRLNCASDPHTRLELFRKWVTRYLKQEITP